ncbi:hypothetical protein NOF04DRAFT_1340983 [Fusarium oxysporum II5]|nr:hypothetical protein NOF04DRAFT_1340983 [Fusarium oxysporum II5]
MYINVYTGMWVDYSNGRITAALSIFLVLVGSQFWSILTFDIHQMNATDKVTDVLHFQHQATFRNAGTSIGATRELLALPFPWRRRQTGPRDFSVTILRSWAWALLALTNFCVWSMVGPFSCAIARSAGSHILITPGTCGIVFDNTSETGLSSKSLSNTIIADTHARGCYESNDSSTQYNSFFPSQESYQPDEDLTLVWLLPNFVFSMTPIDDPFFGFHANHISKRFCQPDNLVNIMACTDYYQVCNPKRQTPICSPLTAAVLLRDHISTIELNPTQNATARLILALNGAKGISFSLGGRGAGALRAGEKVAQSIQIKNWFAISLIELQYALVKYPTGSTSPLIENLTLKVPQRSESQNLCRSMKVPNPGGYKSFSVLALVIVLVVGGMPRVISFDNTRHTWHPRIRTASRAACMNDSERHRGAAPPT